MQFISKDIEQYVLDHTTPLPSHLEELVEFTFNNMDIPKMICGPIEGMLLQFLVWISGAHQVLELGTFTGFSSQMMAAALPANGKVTTCEISEKNANTARNYYAKSEYGHKIEVRLGPALQTLDSLNGPFDLIFIDADKTNYPRYYQRAVDLLSPKGVIAIDNVLWGGRVLDPKDEDSIAIAEVNELVKNDSRVDHVLLPIRDGVMLIKRKGTT